MIFGYQYSVGQNIFYLLCEYQNFFHLSMLSPDGLQNAPMHWQAPLEGGHFPLGGNS
jgi:hypothetical protein